MKFVFIILCFLLIFFNFETVKMLSKTKDSNFIIIWKITENKYLFHVFPHEIFLLLDGSTFYLYINDHGTTEESYVSAVNLKTNFKVNIINYIYLREYTESAPFLVTYDACLTDISEILNFLIKR